MVSTDRIQLNSFLVKTECKKSMGLPVDIRLDLFTLSLVVTKQFSVLKGIDREVT